MGEILGVVGLVVLAAVYVGLGLADHDDACGTCSFGQDSPRCGTCPEAGATTPGTER